MPKKFNKPLHNTLRPVSYSLILLSQAVTLMVQPERLSKILIPYGNIERPDKLGNRYILLPGWTAIKIFPE